MTKKTNTTKKGNSKTNGTNYDRFAMNGGGIKPAGAGSSYVKKTKKGK